MTNRGTNIEEEEQIIDDLKFLFLPPQVKEYTCLAGQVSENQSYFYINFIQSHTLQPLPLQGICLCVPKC